MPDGRSIGALCTRRRLAGTNVAAEGDGDAGAITQPFEAANCNADAHLLKHGNAVTVA